MPRSRDQFSDNTEDTMPYTPNPSGQRNLGSGGPTAYDQQPFPNDWPQQGQQPQQPQQGSYDRDTFRNAWMSSGVRNVPDAQAWLRNNAGIAQGVTMNGDKFTLPDGTIIDAVMGAHAGGNMAGPQWTGIPSQQGGGNGQSLGGGPMVYNQAGGGTHGSLGDQNQQLIDMLMGRAQQSLSINPQTDPIIHPQVEAYGAQQEQSRRNYLNDLAESSNPYATGSLNTAGRQTSEAAGQATGALQSQLASNELTSRRTEIQNALSELGSLLTADQQMALQRELGQLDAALRQQQINSGNDQFMAQYGLNATNQANYWDWMRSNGGQ